MFLGKFSISGYEHKHQKRLSTEIPNKVNKECNVRT